MCFALAVGCSDSGSAPTVPDPNGVEPEAIIDIGPGPFTDLAMSVDGTRMCVGGSRFGFYGLDGKCLPDGPPAVEPFACLSARGYFYSLGQDLEVWDESWKMLGPAVVTDANRVVPSLHAAGSADGSVIAASGFLPDAPMSSSGQTWVTQINVGKTGAAAQGKTLLSFTGTPTDFVFSPDGRYAVVPVGGTLHLVDVATAMEQPFLSDPPAGIYGLAWPEAGGLLVAGYDRSGSDGFYEFDPVTGSAVRLGGDRVYMSRTSLARTNDGRYLIAFDDYLFRALRVFDVAAKRWKTVANIPDTLVAIALTIDGAKLYALTAETLYVYDTATLVAAPDLPIK
jgi:hypothetical protein